MNFQELQINEKISIKYTVQKCTTPSEILIVSFPGGGGAIYDELGYIFTLKKYNCHALFWKADREITKTMLCFYNKTTIVEEKIHKIIEQTSRELGCKKIVVLGSSLGGYCALYYGIKYNWDIIAGSPMLYIEESSYVNLSCGGHEKEDINWVNSQLELIVKRSYQLFNKKIFISFGEGEGNWVKPKCGKDFCTNLRETGYKYSLKLFPFGNHNSIHQLFPLVIDIILPQFLDSSSEIDLSGINSFDNSDISQIGYFNEKIEIILSLLKNQSDIDFSFHNNKYKPANNVTLFTHNSISDELRDFCYINTGYFYDTAKKQAYDYETKGYGFWSIDSKSIDEYLGFQSSILHLYNNSKDPKVIKWLFSNINDFLGICKYYKKGKRTIDSYLSRFFVLYGILNTVGVETSILSNKGHLILDLIRADIISILSESIFSVSIRPYNVVKALFYYAFTIKQYNSTVYENIVVKTFELLNDLNKFNFNLDGLCVKDLSVHEKISIELHSCLNFLKSNGFDSFTQFNKLNSFIRKIDNVNCHIIKPDNTLLSLGHTAPVTTELSHYVARKIGNYIKPLSDLAILEDDNSYIAIGSGNPYKSKYRHCDLMSFSWFYNNIELFRNAGCSSKDGLFEYSLSSFAHNSFFCSDINYVAPDYFDFSTIQSYCEKEDYVVISLAHNLIEGVSLSRKIVWLKPSVLILVDDAHSETEHSYIQNFLLDDFNYAADKDNSIVKIKVKDRYVVNIVQHSITKTGPIMEIFSNKKTSKDNPYRGMIINSNMRSVKQGLNISYSCKSNSCLFLTSIQISTIDKSVEGAMVPTPCIDKVTINNDNNLLEILFNDGSIKNIPI